MKRILTFLMLLPAVSVCAEKRSFDRYQPIVDRQPFGQPPPGFDPQKMASEVSRSDGETGEQLTMEQEDIQKAVGFSMLNVETDGSVMVGFSDRSNPKSPRHYYLAVGESQDGWLVKSCDPAEETMTIGKDGVEVTLKLGENPNPSPASKNGRGARPVTLQTTSGNAAPARAGLLGRPAAAGSFQPASYRGRRARREMEAAQAKAEAEARERERTRQAEEKAAREAAEKEARELERAEQRQQLLAIQEELRKAREEKERRESAEGPAEPSGE